MKKEELLKLGLDDATATKVAEASAEELKNFIPKTRFDEVNDAKKQLELDIKTRDTQLEDLKKSTGDAEALKKQITDLQTANTTAKTEFEAKMKQLQIDSAVERALVAAKAKNTKAVKALLDMTKVELDGENVKGLDDQIKTLSESDNSKFLFDAVTTTTTVKGVKPGEGSNPPAGGSTPPTSLADAVKLHFDKKGD